MSETGTQANGTIHQERRLVWVTTVDDEAVGVHLTLDAAVAASTDPSALIRESLADRLFAFAQRASMADLKSGHTDTLLAAVEVLRAAELREEKA